MDIIWSQESIHFLGVLRRQLGRLPTTEFWIPKQRCSSLSPVELLWPLEPSTTPPQRRATC
jgi:hypothetical protein